ncbi:MAG: hypothetical protein AABO41_19275 [Acidobacteriota bacterium]
MVDSVLRSFVRAQLIGGNKQQRGAAWVGYKLLDSPSNKAIMAGSRLGWFHILHYFGQSAPSLISRLVKPSSDWFDRVAAFTKLVARLPTIH